MKGGKMNQPGAINRIGGDPTVMLNEAHRFSVWLKSREELTEWEKHFAKKEIKTALGASRLGVALFTENVNLGGKT